MELKGNGFTLRPWQLNDAESVQKNADNANVAAHVSDRFPHPYTLADAVAFISRKKDETPVTNFAIIINGEAKGGIGIDMRNDIYRKTPLVGYWLTESYWGQGIVTEALKLITAYAFGNFDIIAIQACVFNKNPASMRVLEKTGYSKQGVLERSVIKNGEILDEHLYIIHLT